MKKPKHVNPKIFLHKVYTEEGGVKEHNKNQQAVGALKLAGAVLIATKLLLMLDKGDPNANPMSRVRTAGERQGNRLSPLRLPAETL